MDEIILYVRQLKKLNKKVIKTCKKGNTGKKFVTT